MVGSRRPSCQCDFTGCHGDLGSRERDAPPVVGGCGAPLGLPCLGGGHRTPFLVGEPGVPGAGSWVELVSGPRPPAAGLAVRSRFLTQVCVVSPGEAVDGPQEHPVA